MKTTAKTKTYNYVPKWPRPPMPKLFLDNYDLNMDPAVIRFA